ncbi:DUF4476 domain-containing protein [Bacteriovoracaceae bacterium]|nr:DUF4476 domain-containing protein [Bacteriovoracaceae bacterium]
MRNYLFLIFLCLFGLVSCGKNNESGTSSKDDDDISNDGTNVNQQNVQGMHFDWGNVPAQFDPHVHKEEFDSRGLTRLNLMIIGIENAIQVTFSNHLVDRGVIEFYRARNGEGSFGTIRFRENYNNLDVMNYTGNTAYQCSSRVYQRQLIELQGACNLFIRITLPASSQIEIYSSGRIFSKRYSPMGFDQLMERLNSGFNQDKFEAIEEYISSYRQTDRSLSLSSFQLEKILKKFTFTDDFKYSALIELYSYVLDQRNLEQVINNSFSFASNREKAKRMVGIS